MVCQGQDNIPFEVPIAMNADSYQWSFSDNEVNITGNGASSVMLSGMTESGTLSLVSQNACGNSAPQSMTVSIASAATCNIINCVKSSLSINNDTLAMADVFEILQSIESDGTVQTDDFKVFRAGSSIELSQGFTVQSPSVFIAEISNCAALLSEEENKK